MASSLHLVSAGAARAVAQALAPEFTTQTGARIQGTYGAVGAMRERLAAGAPCDVVVLSAPLVETLQREGRVVAGTVAPLGIVHTGIAVPAGDAVPDVHDAPALAAALLAATAIHCPDPERATAGIHFVRVLERLHIRDRVAPRLRAYPNGATAMAALAEVPGTKAIGCTQVTEILYTPGVALVAPLPGDLDLATVYSAAVMTAAADAALARRFVTWLTGERSAALRRDGGFEPT